MNTDHELESPEGSDEPSYGTILNAFQDVVGILTPLNHEQRERVMRAALIILGLEDLG